MGRAILWCWFAAVVHLFCSLLSWKVPCDQPSFCHLNWNNEERWMLFCAVLMLALHSMGLRMPAAGHLVF